MKTTDARLALRALAAKATLAAALTTCLSVTAWAQPSQPPTTPELTSLIGRLQARSTLDPLRRDPSDAVAGCLRSGDGRQPRLRGRERPVLPVRPPVRHEGAARPHRRAQGHAGPHRLQRAAAGRRDQGRARPRFPSARDLQRSGLPALPPAGSRAEGPVRRDDPHLPDADRLPAPAGAREGHRRLVREGSPRRLAGADDPRPGAAQRGLRTPGRSQRRAGRAPRRDRHPTLVAADGRVLPGAASAEQINAWLSRSTTSAEARAGQPAAQATGKAP